MPFCTCNLSLLIHLCPISHLSRNLISYTFKEIQNPTTLRLHCHLPSLSCHTLSPGLSAFPLSPATIYSHSSFLMLLNHFSHVQLCVTPQTAAHQAPPSLGFSRQEYWSGVPFPSPEDLPDPGIKPGSPALQADSLLYEPSTCSQN